MRRPAWLRFLDTQGRNQIGRLGSQFLTSADALCPEFLASGDWLVVQMEIPSGEVSKAVALEGAQRPRHPQSRAGPAG